jgi:hypothetical protein
LGGVTNPRFPGSKCVSERPIYASVSRVSTPIRSRGSICQKSVAEYTPTHDAAQAQRKALVTLPSRVHRSFPAYAGSAGAQARGSRFAGVENRILQRPAHDEAPARVQSTSRERSLQLTDRIRAGAESVPTLDRTACGSDLPLRVSRRSRSLATLHSC